MALALINLSLDEVLAEQEGEFDADTRWALAWFDQNGFNECDLQMLRHSFHVNPALRPGTLSRHAVGWSEFPLLGELPDSRFDDFDYGAGKVLDRLP